MIYLLITIRQMKINSIKNDPAFHLELISLLVLHSMIHELNGQLLLNL